MIVVLLLHQAPSCNMHFLLDNAVYTCKFWMNTMFVNDQCFFKNPGLMIQTSFQATRVEVDTCNETVFHMREKNAQTSSAVHFDVQLANIIHAMFFF